MFDNYSQYNYTDIPDYLEIAVVTRENCPNDCGTYLVAWEEIEDILGNHQTVYFCENCNSSSEAAKILGASNRQPLLMSY